MGRHVILLTLSYTSATLNNIYLSIPKECLERSFGACGRSLSCLRTFLSGHVYTQAVSCGCTRPAWSVVTVSSYRIPSYKAFILYSADLKLHYSVLWALRPSVCRWNSDIYGHCLVVEAISFTKKLLQTSTVLGACRDDVQPPVA